MYMYVFVTNLYLFPVSYIAYPGRVAQQVYDLLTSKGGLYVHNFFVTSTSY